MWTRWPEWSFFIEMAEAVFQASLFSVWIFFNKYLVYEGKSTTKVSSYRPYVFALMMWYVLATVDALTRSFVQEFPFLSPWANSVLQFRELALYDFICSVVSLFTGLLVVYQFWQIYSKICFEKSVVLSLKREQCLGLNTAPSLLLFASCLFCCVSFAILQFTHNLLIETHAKFHMFEEDCLAKHLRAPGIFTLFYGIGNMLSMALLMMVPSKLRVEKRNDPKLPAYSDNTEFDKHALHCCLHSQIYVTIGGFKNKKKMAVEIQAVNIEEKEEEMTDEKKLLRHIMT